MPNYVNKFLSIFQHKKPKHDQHSPHPHATPNYGAKIQHTPPSNTSNLTVVCLVVDDLRVKYTAKNDALHLIDTLKKNTPASLLIGVAEFLLELT